MKHAYLDQYSNINSPFNQLHPRVKVLALALFILTVIFTRPDAVIAFALYAGLAASLILLSRVPPFFIFKRSLAIFPFAVMTALFIPFLKENGLIILRNILIKAYLSIICMTLLISSTNFYRLLKALESLKVPRPIILILSFMYRYIFVVQDGLMKMKEAKESRCCCPSMRLHFKANAFIIANLFIRTYEHAEAVYLAMCSRGFRGNIMTLREPKLRKNDLFFLVIMVILLTGIKLKWG